MARQWILIFRVERERAVGDRERATLRRCLRLTSGRVRLTRRLFGLERPVDLIRAPVPGYYGFTVSRVSGMMETKRVGGVP